MAAWREVEGAEGLIQEPEEQESTDSQQEVYAAVEHAAAGLAGRRAREWPQRPEPQRQRQSSHAQCQHYLR
eukprot:7781477-Pyramimonas_sp.AAC.1